MNIKTIGSYPVSWAALVQELSETHPPSLAIQQFLSHNPRQNLDFPIADRWLLTSNLHKAVRYGLTDHAAVTAEALFRCEPAYFYRRLPVIALEDVGLGNLGACLEILTWCRNLPLHRKFQGMGLAGYLGARLAAAPKCRSTCDLLCLVENQQGRSVLDQDIASFNLPDAMEAACSNAAPLRQRAAAFLKLDRLPIRNGDQRAEMLNAICQQLKLPMQATQVLVAGKATDSMATFIPLIFELLGKCSPYIEQQELGDFAAPLDGPILCAAADKHTRLGQRAIKEWVKSAGDLSAFFAQRALTARAERVIRIALFHIESSLLNRRLTNDCLDLLRGEYERSDMAALGLNIEDASELYTLMRRNHPNLNNIRRRLWKSQ
ncbi:MAG: hypothetical protein OSA97_17335 [Nevskia sp.]|nr:hypothetical protein [Nevskia sp.]